MHALSRGMLVAGTTGKVRGAMYYSSSTKNQAGGKETTDPKVIKDAELRVKPTDRPALKKTIAQLDEELRQKMAGLGGDGGAAGVEYEDGRPADLKRSVKNNMFRYI